MRKLNGKNKFYIFIFSIIVLVIVGLLIFSVSFSKNVGKTVYNVSSNSAVFDDETNLIDTSSGGKITKRWDNRYYYVSEEDDSYELGSTPVIYEKAKDQVQVFGKNYQVYSDGSIIENDNMTAISEFNRANFYKLSDRVYLIIASEISNEDKSIYANKYLIVYIDKQGNASVLNDMINVKTINPMSLIFDKYTFDIANEQLLVGETVIDLKLINGSTNEYKPRDKNDNIKVDLGGLVESYNKLVGNFQQYINNNTLNVGSNQQVITNNNVVVNGSTSGGSGTGAAVTNKVNITKKVSLRGAIAYPTYIDVTYLVSDVEDKYQAVYLLVTGYIKDALTTEKIILDKYASTYRISELSPKHEYSISLGYVEVVKGVDGEKTLSDNIEDVINVRTTKSDVSLSLQKISKGNVYFNVKMTNNYALESGTVGLYADGQLVRSIDINTTEARSSNGFSAKMPIAEGSVLELRVENAIYAGKNVELDVKRKFVY